MKKMHPHADLLLKVNNSVIATSADMMRLDPSNIHALNVMSLLRDFSSYKSLDQCSKYLSIHSLDEFDSRDFQFPSFYNFPTFSVSCENAMSAIYENNFLLAPWKTPESKGRYYITAILKAVACTVHVALLEHNNQTGAQPVPSPRPVYRTSHVTVDFEQTFTGTRARGKIDYSLVFQRAVVITVLEATNMNILLLESAIYKLAMQLETIRQHKHRALVERYPHVPSADISKYLDACPSYGVVSTADRWLFVRYHKVGDKWKLERTETILLDLVDNDMTAARAAALKEKLEEVIDVLCGMTLDSVRNAQKLEALLAKHPNT